MEKIENYLEIENIIKRYKKLYTGLVYDVLEELGYPNHAAANDIKPINNEMQLVRPAFTIFCFSRCCEY